MEWKVGFVFKPFIRLSRSFLHCKNAATEEEAQKKPVFRRIWRFLWSWWISWILWFLFWQRRLPKWFILRLFPRRERLRATRTRIGKRQRNITRSQCNRKVQSQNNSTVSQRRHQIAYVDPHPCFFLSLGKAQRRSHWFDRKRPWC